MRRFTWEDMAESDADEMETCNIRGGFHESSGRLAGASREQFHEEIRDNYSPESGQTHGVDRND